MAQGLPVEKPMTGAFKQNLWRSVDNFISENMKCELYTRSVGLLLCL